MSIPKFHLVTEWDLDMYVQYFHSFRYSCGEIILISENQSLPNVINLLMIHETTKNCIVNIMLWPVLQPVFLQITYSHHTAHWRSHVLANMGHAPPPWSIQISRHMYRITEI